MAEFTRIDREDLFIAGQFVRSGSDRRIEAIHPANEEVIGSIADASVQDIDDAVMAAQKAFSSWRKTSGTERANILRDVSQGIADRAEELKHLLLMQNGSPKWWRDQDVMIAQMIYAQAAMAAAQIEVETLVEGAGARTLLHREPIGVVAAIAPWNAPQALLSMKVANALAAGCTVVAKPSPETSLDTLLLAEILRDAGMPEGVFNVVTGGPSTGAQLVSHPAVDKVSFTGSTQSGKAVARECADSLKPLTAELGGKSAAVILDDADLSFFYGSIQRECLPFSGQACFSNTRILVPRGQHDQIVEGIVETLEGLSFGDPSDPQTIMGPVVTAKQRQSIENHLKSGLSDGAKAVIGGGRATAFERGYYIEPTVFTEVTPDMTIFREEIFGPVLTVTAYDSEDEAIALHDATDFGLSGSVFSSNVQRATDLARQLTTGQLLVNGQRGAPNAVRDMYKQSALGGGVDRISGFQLTKGISQPVEGTEMKTIFG